MKDKIYLITGATSGIGLATAKGLATKGATVVMLARNSAKGDQLKKAIQQETKNPNIHSLTCDLSSQDSVRQATEAFKGQFTALHGLMNNAGVFLQKREETAEGIEKTFQTNYLSHFLLTHLLLDPLKASGGARIISLVAPSDQTKINFDDLMLKQKYSFIGASAQSKLALVLFTRELAKRLAGTGITANTIYPGLVKSNLFNELPSLLKRLIYLFAASPEKAAQACIYLLTAPELEGVTGKYFDKTKEKPLKGQAVDDAVAQKLWNLSLELTHLK